jgi:hypothetical protein
MKFVYLIFAKKINEFPETPEYGNYKPEIAGLTLKKDCLNFSDTLGKPVSLSFDTDVASVIHGPEFILHC